MICPRCLKSDITVVGTSSDQHYVCNNENCVDEKGNRTQFRQVIDKTIKFPFNQIFVGRPKTDFYRLPYLTFNEVGSESIKR